MTGYPAACGGPAGNAAGAMKRPVRNASFMSVVRKPLAGAETGSVVRMSGLVEASTGKADHACRAARISCSAGAGIVVVGATVEALVVVCCSGATVTC
jgi:hypothetical protein